METADEPLTVDPETADEPAGMRDDAILELAIQFASSGAYPAGLAKAKKRAVRKRAANLILENGEVFLQRNNRKVRFIEQHCFVKHVHCERATTLFISMLLHFIFRYYFHA